ncbi:hypothetical protein ACFL20_06735 [Spirochaetota bacterium]
MKKIILSSILVILVILITLRYFRGPSGSIKILKTNFYSGKTIKFLENAIILNPILIKNDPYKHKKEKKVSNPGTVCAVKFSPGKKHYKISTFKSTEDAIKKNFRITHRGACGTCSTLKDLAVYMKQRNLTTPVRKCSSMVAFKTRSINCLKKLGFTDSCAQTWYFNALNTARQCLGVCLISWLVNEPFNKKDGSLNKCLACDEKKSGPIFQKTAGRIRRNSGLTTAIKRGKSEVYQLKHDYR